MKFKVGDKVMCIKIDLHGDFMCVNNIYTVDQVEDKDYSTYYPGDQWLGFTVNGIHRHGWPNVWFKLVSNKKRNTPSVII